MNKTELSNLRRDYSLRELTEATVDADPLAQFSKWMDEALASEILDATAMTLSTVDSSYRPWSRVVLLKEFDHEGFVFYTNYESRKANDLESNPHASLHFFWPDLERQIIIQGTATKVSRERSEGYFRTRPLESRLGAWASRQSSVIHSRDVLEKRVAELREQYKDGDVPLPPFWGGFRVVPSRFEFWQGRPSRLHDRICFTLNDAAWEVSRLSP